jgi:dextranase
MILPDQAAYAPGTTVRLSLTEPVPVGARLQVSRLDRVVRSSDVTGESVAIDGLPEGAYGVDLIDADGTTLASTALDVRAEPLTRPRYGFQTDHSTTADFAATMRLVRRLHLNAVQFYDWAWRHSRLLGPERYQDPLGNEVDLPSVRQRIDALRLLGSEAFGYVAVYGISRDDQERLHDLQLFDADGEPYGFGDGFLTIADPSNPTWARLLLDGIDEVAAQVGFHSFHLDQYGWPKRALRSDGSLTDLATTLPALVDQVSDRGHQAIFNNVNGFPLTRSARCRQVALYSEVWPPRTTLADLADLVRESRAASRLPVIVAAYPSCFGTETRARADAALRLVMATVFSSGASHLCAGGDGRLLIDPYYPRNHLAEPATLDLLADWYDFLVRYGDLLLPADVTDITGSHYGEYNADVILPGTEPRPMPGTVWARVMSAPAGTVIHLINLTDQTDLDWDRGRKPSPAVRGLTLRLRRVTAEPARVLVADPDRPGPMRPVEGVVDGSQQVHDLPPLGTWQLLYIPNPEG